MGLLELGIAALALLGQDRLLEWAFSSQPSLSVRKGDEIAPLEVRSQGLTQRDDGILDFTRSDAFLETIPSPMVAFPSSQSFTVCVSLRFTDGRFCTPLMCRRGEAVNYSLVIGRSLGTVSFELWSWQTERAISSRRLDDGRWHQVTAAYDSVSNSMALWVDGELQAFQAVSGEFPPIEDLCLRLGNNIGAHQPYSGELQGLTLKTGVPNHFQEQADQWRSLRVLETTDVDAMLESWLVRQRTPKRPRAFAREEWEETRERIAAQVQDALGLWPPPYGRPLPPKPSPLDPSWSPERGGATNFAEFRPSLPLNPREGQSLIHAGVKLTRVAWSSVEGHDATGWLFVQEPLPQAGSLPAILCPHGHWQDGARHPVVQARCWTLAQHGFVVLAVDSIHTLDDPIGLSPVSVMTWNNLRALEWLRRLPFVDPDRLGCTGASGGGQQTFYLTALDSGLAAAVPAVMVCYFDEILLSSGVHCYCNFVPRVFQAADEPQMSAAFAPRPQLILSVTGDWTKNFPRQGFPEIEEIYRLFGAQDQIYGGQWDCEHDYHRGMRSAMYGFFDKHLRGQSDLSTWSQVEEPQPLSQEALDRLTLPPQTQHSVAKVSEEFRQRLGVQPLALPLTLQDLNQRRTRLRERFNMTEPKPASEIEFLEPVTHAGVVGTQVLIPSEVDVQLPGLLFPATSSRSSRPSSLRGLPVDQRQAPPLKGQSEAGSAVLVCLGTNGARRCLTQETDLLESLVSSGISVLLVDVRYTGELDRAHGWRDAYGRILGRDEGVLAVYDLQRVLDAIENRAQFDATRIGVLAFGDHGAAGLFASAIDPRIRLLAVPDLGSSYRQASRRPAISGILRHGDLTTALCLTPPWSMVGRVPRPTGDLAMASARMRFPERRSTGAADAVSFTPKALKSQSLLSFIQQGLAD